jgi:hypothetical protein
MATKLKLKIQCLACAREGGFEAPKPNPVNNSLGRFDCEYCASFGFIKVAKVRHEQKVNFQFIRFTMSEKGKLLFYEAEKETKLTRITELEKLKFQAGDKFSSRLEHELKKLKTEMFNNAESSAQTKGVDHATTN